MIALYARQEDPALPIVAAAFERSCTSGMVHIVAPGADIKCHVLVLINPDIDMVPIIAGAQERGAKIIVFGKPDIACARLIGLGNIAEISAHWARGAACSPAPAHETRESNASITWIDHQLTQRVPCRNRPFLRFDFANEWNNLGFGAITGDGGPWSLAAEASQMQASVLAQANCQGALTPYVTLFEAGPSSSLWVNRAVGPVDSTEWAMVEDFLSDWRAENCPCVPVVQEIPHGYIAAVTMRLDCDEDIASAKPLFDLYEARAIPFSLAVKTDQEDRPEHISLLKDVLSNNGAILSHSMSHAPNWGGSEDACYQEASGSKSWLEERLQGKQIRYAVSPFHQNPPFVSKALARAGLQGFVGGIVANDRSALLARGGILPSDETGVVTHSQQCMLHGDCVPKDGDPIAIPKQAFLNAAQSGTFFGYLDHPFSERYDYGWGGEERRLAIHATYLDFISDYSAKRPTLWLNEDATLDWFAAKSQITLELMETGPVCTNLPRTEHEIAIRFRGATGSLDRMCAKSPLNAS